MPMTPFKNIRNSYDTRSISHQGNLFVVCLCFGMALLCAILGSLEAADLRHAFFSLAMIAAVTGMFLGLIWLNAKDVYFSENPEELYMHPKRRAREAIARAREMSRRS